MFYRNSVDTHGRYHEHHHFRNLVSSPSLAGSFVYTARTRYVGRIICNQLMSKDKVKFCLLNENEPTYFEVDLSTQDENTSSDPWPKSQETRAARCDKEEVSFCPPVAAANIQSIFDFCLNNVLSPRTHLLCQMWQISHECTRFRYIAAIWC